MPLTLGSSVGPYLFTTSPSLFIRNCWEMTYENIGTCSSCSCGNIIIKKENWDWKCRVSLILANYLCEVPFDVTVKRERENINCSTFITTQVQTNIVAWKYIFICLFNTRSLCSSLPLYMQLLKQKWLIEVRLRLLYGIRSQIYNEMMTFLTNNQCIWMGAFFKSCGDEFLDSRMFGFILNFLCLCF